MLLSDLPPLNHPILKLTQDRRAFRLAILLAVVLGVVALTKSSNGQSTSKTRALHIASTILFLFLTIIQAVQTVYLATSGITGV